MPFIIHIFSQETAHKRLLLAAAALPVLHVPLPAFFLVMPHLIALLELPLRSAPASGHSSATAHRKRRPQRLQRRLDINCARSLSPSSPDGVSLGAGVTAQRSGEEPSLAAAGAVPSDFERDFSAAGDCSGDHSADRSADQWVPACSFSDASAAAYEMYSEEGVCLEWAELARHAEAWVSVLDITGERLGPGLAAESLFPTVLSALKG